LVTGGDRLGVMDNLGAALSLLAMLLWTLTRRMMLA